VGDGLDVRVGVRAGAHPDGHRRAGGRAAAPDSEPIRLLDRGFRGGIGFYLAGLFVLRDYIAPAVVVMKSATASPVVPPIKIAVGLLAISLVAMIVVRSRMRRTVRAPVPVPIGGPSGLELQPQKPTGLAALSLPRISWTSRVEGGSVVITFIAGLATSTPPLEFLGAMLAILASGAAASVQVSAALVFMLVASAMVEIPLVFYLISPAWTQATVMSLQTVAAGPQQDDSAGLRQLIRPLHGRLRRRRYLSGLTRSDQGSRPHTGSVPPRLLQPLALCLARQVRSRNG
jgi:Sap, sulfolipid-1-addressing protein